jgi:hypothetical protein
MATIGIGQDSGGGSGSSEIDMSGYITLSGGTPTIQKSKNIDSITDVAVGQFTMVPITNMASTNWVLSGTSTGGRTVGDNASAVARAVDGVPVSVRTSGGAFSDTDFSFQVTEA